MAISLCLYSGTTAFIVAHCHCPPKSRVCGIGRANRKRRGAGASLHHAQRVWRIAALWQGDGSHRAPQVGIIPSFRLHDPHALVRRAEDAAFDGDLSAPLDFQAYVACVQVGCLPKCSCFRINPPKKTPFKARLSGTSLHCPRDARLLGSAIRRRILGTLSLP